MIKHYKIIDGKDNILQGVLTFNTDTKQFSITLDEGFKGNGDAYFNALYKKGYREVPQHLVDNWVSGRVIPPNRQGLEGILADIGMTEYNLVELFFYSMGKCDIDETYVEQLC